MVNSRNKGKSGELELAHELERLWGVSARRGQQFSGSPDSPDVVTGIPGLHIECSDRNSPLADAWRSPARRGPTKSGRRHRRNRVGGSRSLSSAVCLTLQPPVPPAKRNRFSE